MATLVGDSLNGMQLGAVQPKCLPASFPFEGMKTVGNGWENSLTVPATVFFGRERKRERKNRTGKRNRYYGISGTESIGREHADYDRESITQNGKIHTTTSNI